MDEIIREFIIETQENLDLLDRELVSLESSPSKETLAAVFRVFHTIKGGSGFLAFSKLEAVTHAAESLLSDMRDGKRKIIPEITTSLLQTGDAVRRILASIEENGKEGDGDDAALIANLARLREAKEIPAAPAAPVEKAEIVEVVEKHPQGGPSIADTTVRVTVALLDRLMNLAGELVLARNQILQAPCADPAFLAASQRLNLITTELQVGVMKARMQPISNIWSKFPRIIRDLARTCKKQVKLEMSGEETELDRTIIEAIKDPLTHLLRNAVDHGIDSPEDRAKAGKPAEGLVSLRAFHENGQVNIEIADDGAGINIERVKEKAVQRGMMSAEASEQMSDREAIALIFMPGFSTAEKVSNISGRGVGMDVVKTNIEHIGGSVECDSVQGKGTTIRIKIPLTLAIIPALIVTCGGDRYAIPQVSVTELVRMDGVKLVEHVHGAPVHRLRGELLPLIYLGAQLQVESGESSAVDVVVLQTGERRFGLVVDEVCDTEEIVVKALGKHLKGTVCFAGATIMGDGSVALILDVFGLAQHGGIIGASSHGNNLVGTVADQAQETTDDRQAVLLFDLGETQHMAIPLSTVARLEEFPIKDIEKAAGKEVIQYRGKILQLIRISSFFSTGGESEHESENEDGKIQAVVYNDDKGDRVGLVVGRIRDIALEHIELDKTVRHSWTLGSAVIQNRVTDMLDVAAMIKAQNSTVEAVS